MNLFLDVTNRLHVLNIFFNPLLEQSLLFNWVKSVQNDSFRYLTESLGAMTFKSLDDEKVTLRTDLKMCDEIDTATFTDEIGNVM